MYVCNSSYLPDDFYLNSKYELLIIKKKKNGWISSLSIGNVLSDLGENCDLSSNWNSIVFATTVSVSFPFSHLHERYLIDKTPPKKLLMMMMSALENSSSSPSAETFALMTFLQLLWDCYLYMYNNIVYKNISWLYTHAGSIIITSPASSTDFRSATTSAFVPITAVSFSLYIEVQIYSLEIILNKYAQWWLSDYDCFQPRSWERTSNFFLLCSYNNNDATHKFWWPQQHHALVMAHLL